MPLQFRCGACNQLLGIATRKAGAVVSCPTCGGKTIVPRPREPAKARPDFSLLERVDVDKLLGAPAPGKMATPPGKGGADKHAVPIATASATLPPPGKPLEPKELRALSSSLLPDEGASLPQEIDDDDEPQALQEPAPQGLLVFTKGKFASLAALAVFLIVGAYALGYWLGSTSPR